MKIASKIHPRNGVSRTVTIHGRPYVFLPVEDKNAERHFVAEVKSEEHAAVLLGSLDFYAYGAELAPQPTLAKPAATEAPEGGEPPKDVQLVAFPRDVMEAAEALLNGSASAIGADVGKVKSLDVVKAALAIEKASSKSRKSVVALLEQTLAGAAAAGVTQ